MGKEYFQYYNKTQKTYQKSKVIMRKSSLFYDFSVFFFRIAFNDFFSVLMDSSSPLRAETFSERFLFCDKLLCYQFPFFFYSLLTKILYDVYFIILQSE